MRAVAMRKDTAREGRVYRSMSGPAANFLVGAQRNANDAILIGAVVLKTALAKHVEHMTIRRHHFGGKFDDTALMRDAAQMLEQQRCDAAALVLIEDRECDLGAGAILEAKVKA